MAMLFDPEAALAEIEAMLREAEARAARLMLEYTIAHSGLDLDPDDFDARAVWRGAQLVFEFTPRDGYVPFDPRELRILAQRRPPLPTRFVTFSLISRHLQMRLRRRRAGAFRSARKPTPARTARRFAIPP